MLACPHCRTDCAGKGSISSVKVIATQVAVTVDSQSITLAAACGQFSYRVAGQQEWS